MCDVATARWLPHSKGAQEVENTLIPKAQSPATLKNPTLCHWDEHLKRSIPYVKDSHVRPMSLSNCEHFERLNTPSQSPMPRYVYNISIYLFAIKPLTVNFSTIPITSPWHDGCLAKPPSPARMWQAQPIQYLIFDHHGLAETFTYPTKIFGEKRKTKYGSELSTCVPCQSTHRVYSQIFMEAAPGMSFMFTSEVRY